MIQQGAEKQRGELDYHRICSYALPDVMGVQIQGQYLYIVQPHKISVYEYHGGSDTPQLSEELIHNTAILNYCISQHYICTHSPSLIEVRDRKHWGNVLFTQSSLKDNAFFMVQEHELFISQVQNDQLMFQKINVKSKELVELINLGKVDEQCLVFSRRNKPIFLKEMGMLNNFYILGKNNHTVELGMLYQNNGINKKKFQINQIQLQDCIIHRIFHHKVNCLKFNKQSPEYVVIVAEKNKSKEIFLNIFQILPKKTVEKPKVDDSLSDMEDILSQFTFLGKFNEPSPAPQMFGISLVKEVMAEAASNLISQQKSQALIQVQLNNLKEFQSSFMRNGTIWIVAKTCICKVQLLIQNQIDKILKNSVDKTQKIIKSINYDKKQRQKSVIGIYKQNLLFREDTYTFLLGLPKEEGQQIEQEIQIYEVNDQLLQKQGEKIQKNSNQLLINSLCKDILEFALKKKDEEIRQNQLQINQFIIQDKVTFDQSVNTDQKKKQTSHFQSQTMIEDNKHHTEIGIQTDFKANSVIAFEEVQNLALKYSTSVIHTCKNVKQSSFQKDKFDNEIKIIVDNMLRSYIGPLLQQKFATIVDLKVKQLSNNISMTLQQQIQSLNQNMRKIQVKQNNLKGRRIFDFSNQIDHMKQTIQGVTQALKSTQINKLALNDIVIEQAKGLRQQMTEVQKSISEIVIKNQRSQQQLQIQVNEIFELIKVLGAKEEKLEQESESESEENGEESLQDENIEEEECQESFSQKKQNFQEEKPYPSMPSNHYYQPQHAPWGNPVERRGHPFQYDSQVYPPIEKQRYHYPEYYPQPPMPQIPPPYYYPYHPPQPNPSYQPYYPMPTYFKPNLPQNEKMTHDNSKIRNTKLKNEKKGRTNAND